MNNLLEKKLRWKFSVNSQVSGFFIGVMNVWDIVGQDKNTQCNLIIVNVNKYILPCLVYVWYTLCG